MGRASLSSLTIEVIHLDREPESYRTNFRRKYVLLWIIMKKELFYSTYFTWCKALPQKYLFEQPVLPLHVIGNFCWNQRFRASLWHFWSQHKTSLWIRKQLSWSLLRLNYWATVSHFCIKYFISGVIHELAQSVFLITFLLQSDFSC